MAQSTNESGNDAGSRPVHPQTGPFPELPRDPHDPSYKDTGDDEKTNILDFGLNEDVTVGEKAPQPEYGVKE